MTSGMLAGIISFWIIIVGMATMGFVASARGNRKAKESEITRDRLMREAQALQVVITEKEKEVRKTVTPGPMTDCSADPPVTLFRNSA